MQIIDFSFQELAAGTPPLPLALTPNAETLLTSIFLRIASISNSIELSSSVAWRAQQPSTDTPKLIFRLRRSSLNGPVVFQTTDSVFLGITEPDETSGVPYDCTTDFISTESPDAPMVGTFQQYFLTVELAGSSTATITGPINLTGRVIGTD